MIGRVCRDFVFITNTVVDTDDEAPLIDLSIFTGSETQYKKSLWHVWKCTQRLYKQSKNYRIYVEFLVRLLAYCVRSPVAERRTLRLQSVVSIELVEVSRHLSAPLQVRTEPQFWNAMPC